jgi:hypothetical protein
MQYPISDPSHRFACREGAGLGQQGVDGVLGTEVVDADDEAAQA